MGAPPQKKSLSFFGDIRLLMLFFLLQIIGCMAGPDPLPEWTFKEKAIILDFEADTDLNTVDNIPHTLLVVIYQLDNVNAFNQLAGYEAGLRKLLDGEPFDPSAKATDRFFIEPGEKRHLVLDRAEAATTIGIVCGFYNLIPEQTTTLIPLTYQIDDKGIFIKKREAHIQDLSVTISLGPQTIRINKGS